MAKSPNAFRSISEAADEVAVPQHVLRFWETKFAFVAPMKRAGGRRFYRPQDLVLLKAIKRLLHDEGLTIKGVLRLHKEQGLKTLARYGDPGGWSVSMLTKRRLRRPKPGPAPDCRPCVCARPWPRSRVREHGWMRF